MGFGTLLSPLELMTRPSDRVTVIQFTDRDRYTLLMDRNRKWARLNGYQYRREAKPVLSASHSIYFEKIRMALDTFATGAMWVLWIDDDATINDAQQTASDWISRFPQQDFIVAKEVPSQPSPVCMPDT